MSGKIIALSWVISAISVVCVIIQQKNITNITKILEESIEVRLALENYLADSFRDGTSMGELQVIDMCSAYLTDSTLVAYLPFSLCRACFSSLVFSLQDNNFPFKNIIVLSECDNLEIQSECLSYGMRNIVLNSSFCLVENIIITKKGSYGQIESMRYNLGDEPVLKVFLSNNLSNGH